MLKERKLQLSNIGLSALEYGNESEAQAALLFMVGSIMPRVLPLRIESICSKSRGVKLVLSIT